MIPKSELVHGMYYEGTTGTDTRARVARWNGNTNQFAIRTTVFGRPTVGHLKCAGDSSQYSCFNPLRLTEPPSDW